jgi:hypothetical protein
LKELDAGKGDDGMIDEATLRTLIGAIEDGDYQQIAGYALVFITMFARWFTADRFSETVGKWISTSSSFLAGIGVALAAGGAWWHAVLIGAFAAPTSRGFWELLRSYLPKRHEPNSDV